MQFLLLLQVSLLILGLSNARPGRQFLTIFPPYSGPASNVTHQVTITATNVWTPVTVQVQENSFVQHIFLSASQSKTLYLPPSVGMSSNRSSHLLRVTSVWPVTVVASFCNPSGCDHSLLHDVSSWGTHYYPITPLFPNENAVSQMVILSSDRETSVDIFLSGEMLFEGNVHPRGSILKLHLGALQSVYIQSNSSLSGSEINSKEAVGVVVGFTSSNHTSGHLLYGFCELKPVPSWSFDYIVPPLVNTRMSYSFLLAMGTINSVLDVTTTTGQTNISLIGGVMKVIPVVSSDKIQVTSDSPLQLVYFRRYDEQRPSSLTVLPSMDEICRTEPVFDSGDRSEQQDNRTHTGNLKSDGEFSQRPNFAPLPENTELSSHHTDVGHYLSIVDRRLYPAACEKASCADVHCGPRRKCSMEHGKPLCSLQSKICSAWGDSYYRTFNGKDFVLQGNCNYTLVQTTCPGLNASIPLQINIARAYLNSATVSSIHTVQISIQGLNISLVKEDKNHVRINGQKKNLPLTLGNGSLHFHPSGSGVVLETTFALTLHYDWRHHLQIEVGPELHGKLCGLCGNANSITSQGVTPPNSTDGDPTVDFTLPWVLNSVVGSCIEDCGGTDGASCQLCTHGQAKSFSSSKGSSFMTGCTLLQWHDGPFSDCHSYINPEPFVRSCVTNLCVNKAATSVCKILTAYSTMCQRLGARVQNWRNIAKCSMACPLNSHYEVCGSACPATCADPDTHHNCTLPCMETCQCNNGFLLSSGKCVPHSKCGCLHQGLYYLPKESFWMDECQKRCVCQPNSKTVTCTQSQCRDGTLCKVLNGVLDCHMDGPGVCVVKGASHYTTFDGRNFDVYGNCTYILTSHCPSWGDLEDFRVEVQNQLKDISDVFSRHITMVVSGYSIEMSNDWSNRVMVNGLQMRLPVVLSQSKVKIYMTGLSKHIETDFGIIVAYSSDVLTVQMPKMFTGTLCGLCGNFNGYAEDDVIPDDESDVSQAVQHWKIDSEHECADEPIDTTGCKEQDMRLYQGKDFCGRLLDTEGAFQSCHKTVSPQEFYDNCVHDLCYNNQTTLCQSLASYVSVCQEIGAMVDEWRSSSFCNLLCPSNSEYRLCSTHHSDCGETSSPLTLKCKEGCFCKPEFFSNAGKCVPNSECGCIYDSVYYEMQEEFYPDELCQKHCVCIGQHKVQCTNHTCPDGTKCNVKDGIRACHASQPLQCTVMGGQHFRSYDGHNFDFNPGSCSYILSQVCDGEKSDPVVIFQHGNLHLRVHGVNISLEMEHLGKVKIDGVLKGLPVQLDHIAILQSGKLTRVVINPAAVVTYGGPNLIQVEISASSRRMCGLCGRSPAVDTDDKHSPNGSLASDVSIFASSWSLSPSGTNCSVERKLCSMCNSSMTAEFASDNLCGMLLVPEGSFSGCHSTVDPAPFFQNCVNDLCMSNGSEEIFCRSLSEYTFACQTAGAEVKPWREERCLLLCPENSHYNICVSACPESCGILSDIPCPWACYEGCQCGSGYMQSGNGCIKAEECGCFYHGQYYEIGEISWAEGCSEHCHCSATATMCCEPAGCPEGESCTLNNTWGCARKDEDKTCNNGETCNVQNQPLQTQCWVLGGSHFHTFDGKTFEFQGNCTYTLMHMMNDTSDKDTFWVRIQKDRTLDEVSSIKAIYIKVAEHSFAIYRGERGYAWVNGEKRLLPVNLQHGLVKIYQSGFFVVVDTSLGVEVKYDCSHIATILLSNMAAVNGLCGNNNGIEDDDLRSPQDEAVDATTFGWSWRVSDQEAWCTADCGDVCPRCSAEQLQKKNVAKQWISLYEYISSPQNPFHLCREVLNYTEISAAVSIFDLCSSDDPQKTLCIVLEAYVAACQNAHIEVGEWRNGTNCSKPCPLNSHFEACGTACPATCEAPISSDPCILACVETCQCDPGFILDGDICVPLSQCGCTHNGYHYHSNQTFWADERCTEKCVCDPHTHQTQCHVDSCRLDESCVLENGVRSCASQPQQTCVFSGHHIVTFDQHDYDLHGTCQYQLLGMCGHKQGIDAIQVHVQTDGHLESALHVLVNVSGRLVELNSKNTERLEVDGVIKNMPYHLSPSALAFSLGLHTYIYTDMGFEFSLSTEGIVNIQLSQEYANATCGLCGNFNSDPADDLTASGAEERLSPEQFGKAWRSGQNPWCVEGCLGGSCPKCSSERLALFSDPEACGKILEVNGPFRHCHGKVNPSSFYKRCVSDLCLHGGLQPALCHSLAVYTSVCLSHGVPVSAWRRPGFCYTSCPSSTSYNMSFASVNLCLGLQNNTVEMAKNTGENCLCEAGLVRSGSQCVSAENCGCFYHGEYLQAGQKVSSCKKSCLCNAGGHMTCHNVSCGENEECKLLRGVQGCHPKPKVAHCSVDGSQYTTFDGQAFEFHGSCNYTLVQTSSLQKLEPEPVFITALGNQSKGRQIYLQVNKMYFRISSAFPGKIQVNGVNENLPFSKNNYTVQQKNRWITIKTPQSVELISDLKNHILVKIPNIYRQTTSGLCGNFNDDPSDDLQLHNGSVISDPELIKPQWRLSDNDSSCSNTCDSTCQLCQSPMPKYTSDIFCGLLTHPTGPFSSCHCLVCPQKYYSLCMRNLCLAKGRHGALCDELWAYEAACKEAGGIVDPWTNTTGCADECPQFSHYSPCANAGSSLCPEISQGVQCPRECEEGCQCNNGYFYDGNACVPVEQCGCVHDGMRFKAAESKLFQSCTVNCTCGSAVVCEQYSCPPLHRCVVSDGVMGCHMEEQTSDPCEGKCDEMENCYMSNGVPVCESRQGLCWTWGGQHYHTFDGLNFNFGGTCAYLLAASKGTAWGLKPFSVSKRSHYNSSEDASSIEVVFVQVYGFMIELGGEKGSIYVNGEMTPIPANLLQGKIKVAHKEGRLQLKTVFGLHVVFNGNSTILVTLSPQYRARVYGLCGNFNGDHQDDMAITEPGSLALNSTLEAYRVFDGHHYCCSGCERENEVTLPADRVGEVVSHHKRQCEVLKDQKGLMAHCHSLVPPGSFYESCLSNLMHNGSALNDAMTSYSAVCEVLKDDYHSELTTDVHCPPNSHYKTCGTACPPSCELNTTVCHKACVMGCFCDPGFIKSPAGCIVPHQCGCTDSAGKYHSLNTTYWIPDNCGEVCTCGPAAREVHCRSTHCPKGMVCKELHHKRTCQPEKPFNCTIVTGLHLTTFDGHHFDYRDGCSYSLVQTKLNLTGLTQFSITISDADCHKRFFHSLNLKLSIFGLEVMVGKRDPGKVFVDGLHKPLPFSHNTGHINVYHTPSSIVIHTDIGLQLIVYNIGTLMVVLPKSYASSVSGLCGNANSNPDDDLMMPDEQLAQNKLEFVHSWRSQGAETCRDNCTSRMKHCPAEAQKLFEGSDFCGVLVNELGPFAECASVLSPSDYLHNCVVDTCSSNGHFTALCSSIASYAAACQAALLPVRHWRSDTFCGMSCPKNSHYELCGPQCPVMCPGLSSSANCSGGCEEGCQCDLGYVLSDGQCVLVSDCGCMHEGHYYPAGYLHSKKSCQTCNCERGEVTCSPIEDCSQEEDHALQSGVCQVFAGFGYITFDGVILPHHGACTFLLSALSSKATQDYNLLLSFEKDSSGNFTISRLVLHTLSQEVTVDPKTLWKIQVDKEERSVPLDNGVIKAYQDGHRLIIKALSGLEIDIAYTQYLRLTVPQVYDGTVSGLCGNFNGDRYDDMELRNGRLTTSFAELLQSWAELAPGERCADTCGGECDECSLSPHDSRVCDVLLISTVEFNHCRDSGVEWDIYTQMCTRAVCAGARDMAVCLALEAFSAACQAKGIPIGPWREKMQCALQCPDRSSPNNCVDSSSSSCPALLQPGSPAAGCSESCMCQHGNVFDGGECVPYSQCGCILGDKYIKMDEQLYTKDCTQRCWCHPLGGVLCEDAGCSSGQQCALRNGSWSCEDRPEACEVRDSLHVSSLSGQQLILEPQLPYSLMSLCDEDSMQWFSVISYHGRCDGYSRPVSVFQILLHGSSVTIQDGTVKVNGQFVSLPHVLPSGVSLTSGVSRDKSEVTVILRRDSGRESELQVEVGVTMLAVKVPLWYSDRLCGLCGNLNDVHSHASARSWVLHNFPGCGFTG